MKSYVPILLVAHLILIRVVALIFYLIGPESPYFQKKDPFVYSDLERGISYVIGGVVALASFEDKAMELDLGVLEIPDYFLRPHPQP